MTKSTKIWIWCGIGVFSTAILITPIIIHYVNKPQVGYYLSTNDLYEGETAYVTCLNSSKHDGVSVEISGDAKSNIEETGWNKNKYGIKLVSVPAETSTITINVTKNNKPVISDDVIYLHDEGDQTNKQTVYDLTNNITMQLYAGSNSNGGFGPVGASGSAFIAKHIVSGDKDYDPDGGAYQFYLITNWHVAEMFKEVSKPHYYYNQTTTLNHNKTEIKSFKLLDHGKQEGEKDNIGFDSYLCYANFKGTSTFDNVITVCDANNGYPFKISKQDNGNTTNPHNLFIGGYPIYNQSTKDTQFTFVSTRPDYAHGYKDENYNKPKEMVTMSHYLNSKKYWAIGNDIIMKPTVCDDLMGGASGSIVMTYENSEPTLVGIYWGGRTVDKTDAYCGNIETYYDTTSDDASYDFLNYTVNMMFSEYLNIPFIS